MYVIHPAELKCRRNESDFCKPSIVSTYVGDISDLPALLEIEKLYLITFTYKSKREWQ